MLAEQKPVFELLSVQKLFLFCVRFYSSLFDFNINRLNMYEVVIPINKVIPRELITLKLVKESSKNDSAVDAADIKTASFDFSLLLSLKIEY